MTGEEFTNEADALLGAVEEFGRTAAALGGFRKQLMEQGFHAEAADHLVTMMVGHSLQESSKREAMEFLQAQEEAQRRRPPSIRDIFGGGGPLG